MKRTVRSFNSVFVLRQFSGSDRSSRCPPLVAMAGVHRTVRSVNCNFCCVDFVVSFQGQADPVGVLHLSSFNARAQRDLSTAIRDLEDKGAKSLILDLRDNRGGLVSEGLEVARLFLDGQLLCV